MVSLCSNCLRDNIVSNSELSDNLKTTSRNEDSISKALANLQMKIKILEIQRNEATVKLNTISGKEMESAQNDKSFANNSSVNSANNSNFTTELKFHQESQNFHVKSNLDDQYVIQKSLAKEALKMAEERCEKLEYQLSSMKRLFLSKLIAKDEERGLNKNPYLETNNEYLNSFSDKFLENLFSESESEHLFKFKDDNFENDLQNKTIENIAIVKKPDQSKNNQKSLNKRTSRPNYRNENTYPFILGCSTSASHNSSVKNQITRKTKTNTSVRKRMSTCANMNMLKTSIINLQTIYVSLCKEYSYLFKQKNNIIDSMTNFQETNKTERMQKLNEIIELLHLKKKQIHKIQIMIKNMTDSKNDSNIYSNLTWNN